MKKIIWLIAILAIVVFTLNAQQAGKYAEAQQRIVRGVVASEEPDTASYQFGRIISWNPQGTARVKYLIDENMVYVETDSVVFRFKLVDKLYKK